MGFKSRKIKFIGICVLASAMPLFAFQNCSQGFTSTGALSSSSAAISQLVIDPTPAGITASPQYTVQLIQGAAQGSSFVYQVQNPGFLANGQPSGIASSSTLEQSTAWTSFSFSGSVTVQVTNSSAFTSARILPSSAQITPTVSGNTVSFTVNKPGQFAVEFCTTGATCTETNDTNLTNPMLVFANPVEASVPSPSAANVLSVTPGLSVPSGGTLPHLSGSQTIMYFGPGVYDLGLTPLTINSSQTVYIDGGAYVKGFFMYATGATNASLMGRGILSGENLPKAQCISTAAGCPYMVGSPSTGTASGLLVEGVTFILSPYYNISLRNGGNNIVNNVKIIAWLGNSDGIQASTSAQDTGSVIENSFVKNGDDSIKLSGSNLVVQNCVVWKLNNAAAFQIGAGFDVNLTNIVVKDSDVIRSEYNWPNESSAIFAANQGGSGNLSGYTFENIRVENSTWQLIKIALKPSNFNKINTQLGSISNINFNNIQVTDAQQYPPMFLSFNLAHLVSNVTFTNVVVGGVPLTTPSFSFDANRNMSYAGNAVGDLLFYYPQTPGQFEIPVFPMPVPTTSPQYRTVSISQPSLTSDFQLVGSGDFFGDGYASAVVTNSSNGQVGIWKEPYLNTGSAWAQQFSVVYTLTAADGSVAGVGDFNGDGYSDIVLWNSSTQTGKILLMNGYKVIGQSSFQPSSSSTWSVAGVADFDGNGVSDVLLRDASGNLDIIYYNSSLIPTATEYLETSLNYSSTASYTSTYGSASGKFDTTWSVVSAGIFSQLGTQYADILWLNSSTGQLGMTTFTPFQTSKQSGQLFAILPSNTSIQAIGNLGGGARDLLLWNSSTSQNTIWQLNGAAYTVGPSLLTSLPSGLQVVPN